VERVVQSGKGLPDPLRSVARDGERRFHDLRAVVTDGAGGEFEPVADQVVLVGQDLAGILGLQGFESALRDGERVVGEVP